MADTYAGDRVIYDADGHLMETRDWLHSFADPDVRGLLAPLNLNAYPDPETNPTYTPLYYEEGWSEAEAKSAEENLMSRKEWGALGAVDPKERSRAMDKMGFERQLLFATFCWGQFDNKAYAPGHDNRDLKLLYGGSRAHNRGVAAFCAADKRLLPTAMVPLDDPELATLMLDEVLKAGCAGVIIPTEIMPERSWSHPIHEPFWARLSEANVPAVLHIGTGVMELPDAIYNTGRPLSPLLGDNVSDGWVQQDIIAQMWTVELFLAALAMDGVFARHPNLRVAVCEYDIMWAPNFLARLNQAWALAYQRHPEVYGFPDNPNRHARFGRWPLLNVVPEHGGGAQRSNQMMTAAEYIVERVKITPPPAFKVPLSQFIDLIPGGENMLMFSSDYPHTEGLQDPIRRYERDLDRLGDRAAWAKQKIYVDNFREMFPLSV